MNLASLLETVVDPSDLVKLGLVQASWMRQQVVGLEC